MSKETPKSARIKLEADQITNDYVKIAQNTCNMLAFISSNLQGIPFKDIPPPPVFTSFNLGQIEYVGDKRIYLDMWLYNHGVNDIIKGVNLSLARANYFSDLMSLQGKKMTVKDYEEFEKKTNKKYLRKDLPALIESTGHLVTKPLKYSDHIISINNIRKCLEHRVGKVTEIDAKTEVEEKLVLKLKWIALQLSLVRNGKAIIIEKPGFKVERGEKIINGYVEKQRDFEIGEYIRLDLADFFQLALTGYLFVKHIADNFKF
ncbi:hypothetical protein [Flagellimonas aequoris]|uniref:Uncharacterized protein n=1 Tax=Flagellimonas aequoris TaxID=2306997 RepID=A0A418N9T1_9FLAO|nr:hypothetical protein [Allomuricauda aequoris]RIV72630.1 hypothetical protein D2U88_05185 [Allomuricauda aequoris]TXK05131.1 hypothetical protein FQ019_05150 [Allomuricauda aequoris]